MNMILTCKYCENQTTYQNLVKDGWILAKSHIGAYVCPHCRPEDAKKKS